MATYPFLSDEWIAAARAIQHEHAGDSAESIAPLRMNLVVGDMPFGSKSLDAHLDASSGQIDIDLGHLEGADVTVNLGYGLAKSILVDGDGQAALAAFVTRRLRIDGDMSKLLAFQATSSGPRQTKVTEEIRAITA